MNKIAEMSRLAEVRGTLAAFIDGGLLNAMDQESFDKLASEVSDSFGDNMDYSIEDVFTKTAELCVVAEEVEAPVEGELVEQEKTAAENLQLAMGGLLMNKLAGVMTDEQFADSVTALLQKEAALFCKEKKVEEAPKSTKEKVKDAVKEVADEVVEKGKAVAKAVAENPGKAAAGAAGVAGLTIAGKAAYDKLTKKDED